MLAARRFKTICQGTFMLLINGHFSFLGTLTIYQGRLKSICVPVINCYSCPFALFSCPIGTLQYFIMTGQFPFYLAGFICLVGVTAGRIGCGLMCPFGFLQDFLYRLGHVRINLPKGLSYIKYAVLVVSVFILTYYYALPVFCKICPVAILEAGYPMALIDESVRNRLFDAETGFFQGWMFLIKTVLLLIVVLAAVRIKRVFCRIVCPLGALFSFFNKLSMVHIKVDTEKCTSCQRCARLCPVDLDIYKHQNSSECILCMKCTSCDCITPDIRLPLPRIKKNA